jgi:hypothetical protein
MDGDRDDPWTVLLDAVTLLAALVSKDPCVWGPGGSRRYHDEDCLSADAAEILERWNVLGLAPVTEHAEGWRSGDMKIRYTDPDVDRIYPLSKWRYHIHRQGGRVYRRTVLVLDDWTQLRNRVPVRERFRLPRG